ncbi:sensor histidine kinase [Pedobacter sp. L105]|uniref:sensor histidine kinase n=1 Tax=Pedobacter sp. L105 TaxID=1641871 RepID=UPI00131D95FE|nr:sensor histidine kinase [Pedobacter sp. L105]
MIFAKSIKTARFYRISALVWTLFILYETLITYFIARKFGAFGDYVNSYMVNILIFYVNANIVLPYSYKKPKYILFLLILLEFVLSTLFKFAMVAGFLYLGLTHENPFNDLVLLITKSTWRFIYFMGLSTGYWFALNIIVQRKEISDLENNKLVNELNKQQLEKKLVDSEVAYLKSQINPHFLFNTLNFLYNSSIRTSPELSKPILLLADIMRYALTETPQNGKVDLSDEVEQIISFIAINQYRYDHNLNLSFDISGDSGDFKILPLILLTPVENIFKYADLKSAEYPAKIKLELINNQLQFMISNKKLKTRRAVKSHGIGLKNLKLRLDTYYPNTHHIDISENDDQYIFELQLTL